MFILSQDRKTIIQATQLHVERNLCGRNHEKYALVGTAQNGVRILALYPTKEAAIAEIACIATAITNGVAVYTIPEGEAAAK